MTGAEGALAEVVAWVRNVAPDSPSLDPIIGVNDSDLRQLARLGALLRARVGNDVPASLVAALTPNGPIQVQEDALAAFDALISHEAVVHLADLYATIVTPARRRPLGTFFTPREYAQAIVDGFFSRHDAPAEVIDVGAGVGIFSEIARTKWPAASIQAIDINPLTLGLQAVAAARPPAWNVRLTLADYRSWLESNHPNTPTLYLGNPPYTRWQLLDPGIRGGLLQAANGLVGARANLSTVFLAMTLARLRPEDSLAMIIPAGWMRADYGRPLRGWLRTQAQRRIFLQMADSWRFEEAIVDAVLVEVGPESAAMQPIEVTDWSGSERLSLSRTEGSAAFDAPGRIRLTEASQQSQALCPLATFGRVTRGTASGANEFFVKSPADWDTLGIPTRYRHRLVRRLRPGIDPLEPTIESADLLVLEGYRLGDHERVDAWIEAGQLKGLHQLHLCSKRTRWFDLSSELKTPDLIISALARDVFHVLENPSGCAIMNNLFGLYWAAEATPDARGLVLSWLRSAHGQAALKSSASVEANGLHRLSPKAMGALTVSMSTQPSGGTGLGLAVAATSGGSER